MQLMKMNPLAEQLKKTVLSQFGIPFDRSSIFLDQEENSVPVFEGASDMKYEGLAFRFETRVDATGLLMVRFLFPVQADVSKDFDLINAFNADVNQFFSLSVLEDKTLCLARHSLKSTPEEVIQEFTMALDCFKKSFDSMEKIRHGLLHRHG